MADLQPSHLELLVSASGIEELENPMAAASAVLALSQGAACGAHDVLIFAVSSRAAGRPVALTETRSSPAPLVSVIVATLPTPAFVTATIALIVRANISSKEGSLLVHVAAGSESCSSLVSTRLCPAGQDVFLFVWKGAYPVAWHGRVGEALCEGCCLVWQW